MWTCPSITKASRSEPEIWPEALPRKHRHKASSPRTKLIAALASARLLLRLLRQTPLTMCQARVCQFPGGKTPYYTSEAKYLPRCQCQFSANPDPGSCYESTPANLP